MTSALPSRRVIYIYIDIPFDVAHPTLRGSEGLDFVGQKERNNCNVHTKFYLHIYTKHTHSHSHLSTLVCEQIDNGQPK